MKIGATRVTTPERLPGRDAPNRHPQNHSDGSPFQAAQRTASVRLCLTFGLPSTGANDVMPAEVRRSSNLARMRSHWAARSSRSCSCLRVSIGCTAKAVSGCRPRSRSKRHSPSLDFVGDVSLTSCSSSPQSPHRAVPATNVSA
eukprot:3210964-Pleurochrysis_carterae.AAC.1